MPVDQIARTFGVDWPHLLAQTISFSIVCALLYGFAYTPVLETLVYLKRETPVWLEITTLLIPGENDSDAEIDAMTQWIAAELGYLDDVIEPRDTRPKLIAALEMLRNKRQTMPAKKHGNPPL